MDLTTPFPNGDVNFQSIVENAVVGIFQKDLAGNYLCANPALAHLYGYPRGAGSAAIPAFGDRAEVRYFHQ